MKSADPVELLAAFERQLRRERGYKRSAGYASPLRLLASFLARSGRTLLQITPEDLEAFRASRPSMASATFRNQLSILRSFFTWLAQNGHVEAAPVFALPKLAAVRFSLPEDALCSKGPAGSLETHAQSFLPELLHMLLHHHDLLRSEILTVNIGDIDPDFGIIRIGSSELRAGRSIAVSPETQDLLRRYLTGERGLDSPEARHAEADRPAFLNVSGGALNRQQFAECLRWSQGVKPPASRVDLARLRLLERTRQPHRA